MFKRDDERSDMRDDKGLVEHSRVNQIGYNTLEREYARPDTHLHRYRYL
jgi:hypothetical protein